MLVSGFAEAQSQQQDISAEPVVITVSEEALPLSSVSASVTIITRETIENSRAETVLDLLQEVPFVHLSRVGGAGGLATATIRGGDPNFTMVMIDGIPVNDPTNLLGGSYDFSSLSVDQVDRIEIVRGPLSSLYGSEAISGVINIISRQGSGPASLFAEARYGRFDSEEFRAGFQGQLSRWTYSFSGSYYDVDEQVISDSHSLKTGAFQSGFDFDSDHRIRITGRVQESDRSGFPENGGGPVYSILRDPELTDSLEALVGILYQQPSFSVEADHFNIDTDTETLAILDSIPPGFLSIPSFSNRSKFDRTRLQLTGFWKKNQWSVTAGAGLRREAGNSEGVIAGMFPTAFELERDTGSIATEVLYNSSQLHASAGIRVDAADGFQPETSPRFGVTYSINSFGTRLKATLGEGYKLPSFFALGDPNIGNPDLLPERSRGWDIGVDQDLVPSRVFLSAVYFDNSFRDLIDFSPEQFRLVNRREVTSRGVELEARARISSSVQITGHLSYTDSDIEGSEEPLRDRPRWKGGAGIDWDVTSNSQLHLQYRAVGDRFDFQIPVPDQNIAEAYNVLDLAFSYRLMNRATVFVRVDNLLDNEFQEFVGFPDPGIYARAGFAFSFETQKK